MSLRFGGASVRPAPWKWFAVDDEGVGKIGHDNRYSVVNRVEFPGRDTNSSRKPEESNCELQE